MTQMMYYISLKRQNAAYQRFGTSPGNKKTAQILSLRAVVLRMIASNIIPAYFTPIY